MSLSLLATSNIPLATSENPLRRTKFHSPLQVASKRMAYTTCELQQRKEEEGHVTDRRNVLIGLGGLYGATATVGSQDMTAIGAPVQPPDLSTCRNTGNPGVNCCPPYTFANIVDFMPPSPHLPLRVRKPAHMLTYEEKEKFNEAIRRMKALPPNDPWNYYQQATIHCTFCSGAFNQVGTNVPLQVHGSWLFLPWHRYYIYFWEKILGRLIGDPTFAIPYWNWDDPVEMSMPYLYLNGWLYDDNRDHNHWWSVLDYNYSPGAPNPTPDQVDRVFASNLCQLHSMFRETLWTPHLFMGRPLSAGQLTERTSAPGRLEQLHNVMHLWTGRPNRPFDDMGDFSTAARDTMFFGHHANIDRIWDFYRMYRGYSYEFYEYDFLEAAFIFYDENRQVVKVKVKDCLRTQQLGYAYTGGPIQWGLDSQKCRNLNNFAIRTRSLGESVKLTPVSKFGSEPRSLTEPIRALVTRPNFRNKKATVVLIIEDIKAAQEKPARFDVYVTKPTTEGLVGPDKGELAGSFVQVPHTSHHEAHTTNQKTNLELGITALLEDIGAEALDKLVVTLVPRLGEVSVGGVHIDLF